MQDQVSSSSGTSSKRSRITRACDTCRRKKIKCDVNSMYPCTTCKQYSWECSFQDVARKRGPPKGYIESLESRLKKLEKLLQTAGGGDDQPQSPLAGHQSIKAQTIKPNPSKPRPTEQSQGIAPDDPSIEARKKLVSYHGSSSGYYLVGNILHNNSDNIQKPVIEEEDPKVFTLNSGPNTYRLRKVNQDDDDLMVVRDLTADEFACQSAIDKQENIEDIVPRSVLEALVKSYFSFEHVTLPVVEKEEYLDAFEGRTSPPPAPLLTYAICSYACFLINSDASVFKESGIERDKVFQILVDRASVLVRREYLIPRIVTVQALVLLCTHPTYSTSTYRNWILAGMAVRMAQDLGLHRTLTTVEVCEEFKERRKRLWYSVYVTDRWCCALMGRPLAIADSDCDVDLPLLVSSNKDYTVFVNFVKLSGILGEILRRIYSPKAKSNGYQTKAMEHTVYSIKRMLDDWFASVPSVYKLTEQDIDDITRNPNLYKDTKKISEGGPLTVCYHAVVLLLHRPFIVLNDKDNRFAQTKLLCSKTAKLAVDVARVIPHIMISKFGWNFAVYATYQAALIHVYNCTDSDSVISNLAKEYVHICIDECLQPIARDIPTGPPLITFLQTLLSLIGNNDTETTAPSDMTQPSFSTTAAEPSTIPFPLQNDLLATSSKVPEVDSWLINGAEGNLSQAAWQQLFSMAGTPFSESNNRTEAQGKLDFFNRLLQ